MSRTLFVILLLKQYDKAHEALPDPAPAGGKRLWREHHNAEEEL